MDDLMLSPEELLKIAIQNGMITEDELWAQAEMNQRKKYLEMHEYKVWQASDGYWKTESSKSRLMTGMKQISSVSSPKTNHLRISIID